MKQFFLILSGLALLTGCSSKNDSVEGPVQSRIRIAPSISRVTGLNFDTGDRIGLTIVKSGANYCENTPLRFDGTVFVSDDLFWYDDPSEKSNLTAYYPYLAEGAPASFTVRADQKLATDHGLNDTSLNMSPGYLACRLQSNHTPMLIYAPGLVAAGKLQPGVDGRPCGQPDIFPTLASLAGIPYRYNAMGRNLLDPDTKRDEMQFLGGETESTVRLVENGYCYIRETDEHMYKMDAPVLEDLLNTDPERAAHMRQYAQDFYNASKYLLYNNKKFD